MYDLTSFQLSDMTKCGARLRRLSEGVSGMLEVADRTTRFLYDSLRQGDSRETSCALVRFFKTHRYDALSPDLKRFAQEMLGHPPPSSSMPCLTLLATSGDEPSWNSPIESLGHRAIPLVSESMVAQSPMISQLIQQLGFDVTSVLQPDPNLLVDLEQKTYNVFHVPRAEGSPYVPAQTEFVTRYGIESVLGFGGMLPTGELFAIILFSKVAIPRETAEMFRSLALNVKVAILPFAGSSLLT